jgi:putative ABC transport system substrate-binding protein
MQRIGMLIGSAEDDPEMKFRLASFRRGLERRGWWEGRNVRIDARFAEGSPERYRLLAKELVGLQPDVISVAEALRQESRTIPIVFVTVSDSIGSGFISSLGGVGGKASWIFIAACVPRDRSRAIRPGDRPR